MFENNLKIIKISKFRTRIRLVFLPGDFFFPLRLLWNVRIMSSYVHVDHADEINTFFLLLWTSSTSGNVWCLRLLQYIREPDVFYGELEIRETRRTRRHGLVRTRFRPLTNVRRAAETYLFVVKACKNDKKNPRNLRQ